MDWKQWLAYITGSVEEELFLRNEYLVAENRILRDQIKGRIQLSDIEGIVKLLGMIVSPGGRVQAACG
jgi:hypothetical protein